MQQNRDPKQKVKTLPAFWHLTSPKSLAVLNFNAEVEHELNLKVYYAIWKAELRDLARTKPASKMSLADRSYLERHVKSSSHAVARPLLLLHFMHHSMYTLYNIYIYIYI